jgi:alpha-tubulin suppressor-like RCC1 family protein
MPLPNITTNFKFRDGSDIGEILVTKDYFLSIYPQLMPNFLASNLIVMGYTPPLADSNLSAVIYSSELNWRHISGAIWPGFRHVAAIKTDGTLWTGGSNSYGELGRSGSSSFTKVGTDTDWRYVTCGSNTTAAIKNDGTLWVTGRNIERQLGLGDANNRSTFTKVSLGDVRKVSAGAHSMIAISGSRLYSWGRNYNGILGISDSFSSTIESYPKDINFSGQIKDISMNNQVAYLITYDGGMYRWGDLSPYGGSSFTSFPRYVSNGPWKSVSAGIEHTGAIKTDGTLWMAGDNSYGSLGNGTTTDSDTFIQVPGIWKQVSCGNFMTGAIRTDGSLWTWGNNLDGQLGQGLSSGRSSIPAQTTQTGYDWRNIACGAFGIYGIKSYEF